MEGDALYVAMACHLTVLHDEDERIAARLQPELGSIYIYISIIYVSSGYMHDMRHTHVCIYTYVCVCVCV